MPAVSIAVPHALGEAEANTRLKNLLAKLKERHADKISDLAESWQDNLLTFGFKTFGFQITGKMEVRPSEVAVSATLPLAAMMFKSKIEQTVREEITKLLS